MFSTDIRADLLRYCRKKIIATVLHKIDNFPGKITLLKIFGNNYAEKCHVYFLFFFFWRNI